MNYKSNFILILITTFFTCLANAQPASKKVNKNQIMRDMPAEDVDQKLAKDLVNRVPEAANVTVAWKPVSYGYMAFYATENRPKMSLYTTAGKFSRSFTKESWETRVPENVKMEFDNSPYNTFSVINFWESDAADNKMYFLEMQDKEGMSKEAWFDENGKFYDNPF